VLFLKLLHILQQDWLIQLLEQQRQYPTADCHCNPTQYEHKFSIEKQETRNYVENLKEAQLQMINAYKI